MMRNDVCAFWFHRESLFIVQVKNKSQAADHIFHI